MTYDANNKKWIPDNKLLVKYGISVEDFLKFFETEDISYRINSNASQYYGASIAERNMLGRHGRSENRFGVRDFFVKHKEDWRECRNRLSDKMNDYSDEFYNYRPILGSPTGKRFS